MEAQTISLGETLEAAAMRLLRAAALDPGDRAEALGLASKGIKGGYAAEALPLLAALHRLLPGDPEVALLRGIALRLDQQLLEAADVFEAALPGGALEPALVEGLAQTRYELGLPAATLFAQAQRLLPGNADVVKNRAAAMAAEGDVAGAEALLEAELVRVPGWLGGHKTLATLRWTRGDPATFDASYAAACHAQSNNKELWLAWFGAVAQARDWGKTKAVLDKAVASLGEITPLITAQLFLACESGDVAATEALLERTANLRGDTVSLCRVRHWLRQGRFAEAEALCLALVATPSGALFLPYLSLAWRAQEDERWIWLDRPEELIKSVAVDLSTAEYAELAEVLRGLHQLDRPYAEQSVRGGTQTDRSVILRHEPIIQKARAAWLEAIRGYVAALPPREEGHPLLGLPRGELYVEGSWSVRLLGEQQGHNVPHNHPAGWLSTAFYIALPDELGEAPAGHIAFGTPPEELGLSLSSYKTIAPQVGQTAIFPSYLWHRTMPFAQGERLALALDIRRPRR
jgi:tetratricopeptide (TPR) repeat protein